MTTTKQYDALNRLTSISSAASNTVAYNYSYNSANQRTQDKLADGSYWIYQYDTLGQVIGGHKYFYDGTAVPGQQFDYGFDTIGNRTQTKAGGDVTGGNERVANYAVNNLNQITSRDYPGTNDIVGVALATNAVTVNGQPAFHKWEYFDGTVKTNNTTNAAWVGVTVAGGGAANLGSVWFPQTPEQFLYDADGNLTNDGRWSYIWDAENRLTSMTVNTNVGPQYQLIFTYDAKGRRIQKQVATNNGTAYVGQYTNNFVYDGWNLVATLNPQLSRLNAFAWGNDLSGSLQGAGGVGGLLEVRSYGSSTTNSFAAFDGNGNVGVVVNAADGTTLANYEYGPFGEVVRTTGPMDKANPIRFSTKYDDDESDLLCYGKRYYKASTGAWINRDPIGERGGQNIYSFVKNAPTINYDPNGKLTVTRLTPDPISANCGDYEVYFQFTLDQDAPQDGYIVQKIYIHNQWTQTDRYGHPDPHDQKKSYFEAWRVAKGQRISTTQPKKANYTDKSGGPQATAATGTGVAIGEIRFYTADHTGNLGDPGADPTPVPPDPSTGWKEDPNGQDNSGILPYYGYSDGDEPSSTPSFWNNPPDNGEAVGHRWVFAMWTCSCGGNVSTPISGSVVAWPTHPPIWGGDL